MGKRSKRQNKDPLEFEKYGENPRVFWLKKHQSDAKKSSGPVEELLQLGNMEIQKWRLF